MQKKQEIMGQQRVRATVQQRVSNGWEYKKQEKQEKTGQQRVNNGSA
jgi:hypothetical protein